MDRIFNNNKNTESTITFTPKKPKIVCVLGETCSGKDHVLKEALNRLPKKKKLRMVCSYADRPMRDGETEGIEHYFISTEEFNKLKKERENDILAYTHIKNDTDPNAQGYQYMALVDELKNSQLYVIDPKGLQNLVDRHGDKYDIIPIYIHASLEQRRERAKNTRSDYLTEFDKRVENEKAQFENFKKNKLYEYKIENGDGNFDHAVNRLMTILNFEFFKSYKII